MEEIHSSLVEKSLPCLLVEFCAQKLDVAALSLGLLKGELHLKTGIKEIIVVWELEVVLEKHRVHTKSEPEVRSSSWVPNAKALHGSVL